WNDCPQGTLLMVIPYLVYYKAVFKNQRPQGNFPLCHPGGVVSQRQLCPRAIAPQPGKCSVPYA
ncbi:MAG: hypothetical protein VKJ27_05220, partial [Synechocystis sp.]|nr:hypothetical protein [Synechocystis sp.]